MGGDSAGGALAAACTLRSREEGKSDICFQMLIYPVLDARMKTESMKKYTDSPVWNARLSKKMWELYLKNGTFGKSRRYLICQSLVFAGLLGFDFAFY